MTILRQDFELLESVYDDWDELGCVLAAHQVDDPLLADIRHFFQNVMAELNMQMALKQANQFRWLRMQRQDELERQLAEDSQV